jgi:hypothetical protein
MKMRFTVVLGALASIGICGLVSAQELPPNRVYVLHSQATGPCPALDWHLGIDDVDHTISGFCAWGDKMQSLARANGTFNQGTRTLEIKAQEVGGQNRTAEVTGTVREDGWLVANITGPNISCQGVKIPWYRPGGPG